MTDQDGVWLHAIGRDLDPARLAGLAGIGGEPVRTVHADGLGAVVTPVDLAEYGEQALRRNLEDISWLAPTARAHHRVVSAVGGTGPVLPARLATVYRSAARVNDLVARRRQELTAVLDRLAGRAEWGVKALAVPDMPAVPVAADDGGGSGASYLRRRRAQLVARETTQQAALDSVEAVHAALAGRVEAAARHRPQDPGLSGEPGTMLLNGAYLVEYRGAADFADAVRQLGEQHPAIRLQLTGPWPPYSFAAIDLEGPAVGQEARR
jgi:Gas vesicle synthesis protein GvpL/GvpF